MESASPWEDHLLERKTDRELKDLRRTAVAFGNSVMPGHTAVILIGEGNHGNVTGVPNADVQQIRIRNELDKIYPPLEWRQQLYEKENKTCIRVEIEYSGDTPHFGDAAWIRQGSETVKASDEMLQKLVELRTPKVRELTIWLGKAITVSWSVSMNVTVGPNWNMLECVLAKVTGFYATFRKSDTNVERSEPLSWLDISWDDSKSRLRVFVNPTMARMF